MINLEPLAVKAGAEMIGAQPKESENMINKALMVLAEQGITAFSLFLASRKRQQDTQAAEHIHRAVRNLLTSANLGELTAQLRVDDYKVLTHVQAGESDLSALQRLLLTKQLIETGLTYGRYQAKARAMEV